MAERVISLIVNGGIVAVLNTNGAVAADYLNFLNSVVRQLLKNKEALEAEANKSGRTLAHGFLGIASLPLGSVLFPEVADKQMTEDRMNDKKLQPNLAEAKSLLIEQSEIIGLQLKAQTDVAWAAHKLLEELIRAQKATNETLKTSLLSLTANQCNSLNRFLADVKSLQFYLQDNSGLLPSDDPGLYRPEEHIAFHPLIDC